MLSHSRLKQTIAVGSLLVFASLSSFAADTPTKLDGATLVTVDQAKDLLAKGTPFIDSRVANEYAEGHIKGAINVPYKEKSAKDVNFDSSQDSFDVTKLPKDKGAGMVIYCNGPECWKSYKASVTAIKAGYKTVYWFRSGFPDWKAKGLPIE